MSFALQLTTPPASEPVSLADMKAHLRVDFDDDDAYITDLISDARELCEIRTRRQFVTATWKLTLDYFPGRCPLGLPLLRERAWEHGRYFHDRSILLPRPPLQSVTAITYRDTAGVVQTLDPSQYLVDAANEPGRVSPAYGTYWPDTLDQIAAVTVTYVAGYASPALLPRAVLRAIKFLAGHWYDGRNAAMDREQYPVPMAVDSLLSSATVPWIH